MNNKKFKIAILKNENKFEHELWVKACLNNPQVESFDLIELIDSNWITKILEKEYDIYLLKPAGMSSLFKQLYDERIYILKNYFNKMVYPSIQEVFIYENKRLFRDWLIANKIPHPQTHVFFKQEHALHFIENDFKEKIVAKTNIGASGNGVQILKTKQEAENYISISFSSGVKSKSGPKFFKGSVLKKITKAFKKGYISSRYKEYQVLSQEVHKGFVIFQEFIPHQFEWRCVLIGDSYFAHKKMVVGEKSSGTLKKDYGEVPLKLLDFIKDLADRTGIKSAAIDIFEHEGGFLVNEIQCFFGQSDPYQMLVEGKPGRYLYKDGKWAFEEGMFNTNQCYDLRLEHALSLIK